MLLLDSIALQLKAKKKKKGEERKINKPKVLLKKNFIADIHGALNRAVHNLVSYMRQLTESSQQPHFIDVTFYRRKHGSSERVPMTCPDSNSED